MLTPIALDEKFEAIDKKRHYLISNYGRCYSVVSGRFLKSNINSNGYLRYDLAYNENNKRIYRQQIFAHIEVVKHFGDCNGNTISELQKYIDIVNIDHRDRNRLNNKQSNLQIVSAKVNQRRKFVPIEEVDSIIDDIF